MNKLFILAAAGILSFSFIGFADDVDSDDMGQEKCYCIAFAGQNDGKAPNSNLPDKSTEDNDCNYWKYVPKGSCEEVGGSLTPGGPSK